jgi:copper(I)-binding protein
VKDRFTEFSECFCYIELTSGTQLRGDVEVDTEFVTAIGDCCSDAECDLTVVTVINKKSIAAMRMVVTPFDVEPEPSTPPKSGGKDRMS